MTSKGCRRVQRIGATDTLRPDRADHRRRHRPLLRVGQLNAYLKNTYQTIVETVDPGQRAAHAAQKATIVQLIQNITATQEAEQTLAQQIADTTEQGAIALTQAVNQAKQNLVTIGQDIATNIGDYITAPLALAGDALQLQSDRLAVIQQGIVTKFAGTSAALAKSNAAISLRSAELSLQELRLSVPFPGGGQLSANPQEALKQLEAFGKTEPLSQQTYFQSFIDKYKTAVNAVQSAQIALAEATPVQRAQEQANIQLRQAELSAANDRANILKTAATNEINDW